MLLLMTFAIGVFFVSLINLVVFFQDFVRLNHRLTIAKSHDTHTHKKLYLYFIHQNLQIKSNVNPVYIMDTIIYYQNRDMDDTETKKYKKQ